MITTGGVDGHCSLLGRQPCGHAGREGAPGLAPPPCGRSRLVAGPGGGPAALTHVNVGEGRTAWAPRQRDGNTDRHRPPQPRSAPTGLGDPAPAPPPPLAIDISADARRGAPPPQDGPGRPAARPPATANRLFGLEAPDTPAPREGGAALCCLARSQLRILRNELFLGGLPPCRHPPTPAHGGLRATPSMPAASRGRGRARSPGSFWKSGVLAALVSCSPGPRGPGQGLPPPPAEPGPAVSADVLLACASVCVAARPTR